MHTGGLQVLPAPSRAALLMITELFKPNVIGGPASITVGALQPNRMLVPGLGPIAMPCGPAQLSMSIKNGPVTPAASWPSAGIAPTFGLILKTAPGAVSSPGPLI